SSKAETAIASGTSARASPILPALDASVIKRATALEAGEGSRIVQVLLLIHNLDRGLSTWREANSQATQQVAHKAWRRCCTPLQAVVPPANQQPNRPIALPAAQSWPPPDHVARPERTGYRPRKKSPSAASPKFAHDARTNKNPLCRVEILLD